MRIASTLAVLTAMLSALPVPSQAADSPVYPHLKALECFIGDWKAEATMPDGVTPSEKLGDMAGKTVVLSLSVRWAPGKCAQIINVNYQVKGVKTIKGTAIRGWNQEQNQIRQYQFTTHMGVWTGEWTQDGKTWIAEFKGRNLDGKACSTRRVTTFKDKNHFVTKETKQIRDGKPQPDTEWHFKRQ